MKAFINFLYALSRVFLVGLEFAHANSLFALFHIAPMESWGFFACSVVIKGFAFLDQSGLVPIRNRRLRKVVHVGNILILCSLWLLISLFDFEDQQWRTLAHGWPVLLIVGFVMAVVEFTLQTTLAIVREHRAGPQTPDPAEVVSHDAFSKRNIQINAQFRNIVVLGLFFGLLCWLFYPGKRRI